MTRAAELLKAIEESTKSFIAKDPEYSGEPSIKSTDGKCLITISGRGRKLTFWAYCDLMNDEQGEPTEYESSYDAEMALKKKGSTFDKKEMGKFNDFVDDLM